MCITCRQGGRCDRTDSIGRPRDRSPAGRGRGRSRRRGGARAGQGVRAQPGHGLASAQDVAGAPLGHRRRGRPLRTGRDRGRAGRGRGAGRRDRGGAPGAGADVRADRRDGVAGDARRRWAHVRGRGHPGRRADGELAGPHRAVARHVDGQGAARVPAARRAAPGAALDAARRSPTPRSRRPWRSTRSWSPPAPAATARARASWSRRCTACRHRCSTAPAVRSRCCRIWGPKDRVPEQRFAELGPIVVAAAREVGCGPEAPLVVA